MESNGENDQEIMQSSIASIIRRGGTGGMTVEEKAKYVQALCKSLGLNPLAMPIQFITFQGKEIAYITRGATDQLAAKHNVSRSIVDGPMVKDFAGTKLLYCRVEAKLPNGRTDTSIATAPSRIDENALMKVESKAKRRVTLSILGLGMLAEDETDDLSASESPSYARSKPRRPVDPVLVSQVMRDDDVAEALNADCAEALSLSDPDEIALSLSRVYAKYLSDAKDVDRFFATMKFIAKSARCATRFQTLVQQSASAGHRAPQKSDLPNPIETSELPDPIETSGLEDALDLIASAETPAMLGAILAEHSNVPIEDKKALWSAGCKRLQALRESAGLSTDLADAQKLLRAILENERAAFLAREADRFSARSAPALEDTAKPAATIFDPTPEGERLWIDHLEAKVKDAESKDVGNDGGALAGSFIKREKEFEAAGVRDDRLRTVVNIVARVRGRSQIEAMTFVGDLLKRSKKHSSKHDS